LKLEDLKVGDVYSVKYSYCPIFFVVITDIDDKNQKWPIGMKYSNTGKTDRCKPGWFDVDTKTKVTGIAWELFS
jgi:hypothetical protein